MKKFLGICLALLCMSFNSVGFGHEKPDKEISPFNYNDATLLQSMNHVVMAYEITPAYELACDSVIQNNSYKIEKNKTGLVSFVGICDHPLRLCRWDSKTKINDPILYKEPFVDTRYVWEFSHQFNC